MSITVDQAIADICAAGLIVSPVINYAYSASVPNNHVISQVPLAGASVPWNTPVQLTVSLGVANTPMTTSVPNVVGKQLLDAQHALAAASLSVSAVAYVQAPSAINSVTAQSPGAGGPVPVWTQVALTVCSGPLITYPGSGDLTVPVVS